MPKYSQADRPMAVATPLGPDVLLLQQFSGSEALSRLFHFQLELLAESSTDIAFDQILGQSVTVSAPDARRFAPLHQRHRQPASARANRSPPPWGAPSSPATRPRSSPSSGC